jgi:HPt (histidine-containing phosphotransfer) domain-containing protein
MNKDLSGAGLDRQVALSRVGGDTELLREIAVLFLSELPTTLEEIRAAIQAGDAESLERSAHGLKGAVANFGARAAVDAAFRLETIGRSRNLADASAAFVALEETLGKLRPELESL